MRIPYWRYSATGNTFLIFDNRQGDLHEFSKEIYSSWAHEQKVDGLLFLSPPSSDQHDFHMRYLNADGGEVEMCGNGARSIIHFVNSICQMKSPGDTFTFSTKCAVYSGVADSAKGFPITMSEVAPFDELQVTGLFPKAKKSFYLFTGVPHCCFEVDDLDNDELMLYGKEIRYNELFENGCNVNFFKVISPGVIHMRTYERGVEAETDSCGTGATATALCAAREYQWEGAVNIKVPGGELVISFDENFGNVFLSGAVDFLGEGAFNLEKNES